MRDVSVKKVLKENFIYFALLTVFISFSILLRNDGFFTTGNLLNVLIQSAPIAIMAMFTCFVLSAREIDLSIGAIIGLSTLVAATSLQAGFHWILAALAALLACSFAGFINGFFVTVVKLPSFLTTLAFMGVITGIARWTTNLRTLSVGDRDFAAFFGGGKFYGIPSMILWAAVLLMIGYVILQHTKFGAWVLAVGDNPISAQSQGIKVSRVKMLVMVFSGFGAGLIGLLYAGRLESASYMMGSGDTLTVIAATVIGGTSLFGGKGSIPGLLAGSVLLGLLTNGLLLAGFSVTQQIIVQGLVLLLALSVASKSKADN
jgi:ribose transport system permease protein